MQPREPTVLAHVVPATDSPIKPQSVAALSPSSVAAHARLSAACRAAAAPSFAALNPEPDTQARARAAGMLCCRCSCRDICLLRGRSTRGSAGSSILLVGNLEHCSSQSSSIRSCSRIAAESWSCDLRWGSEYVLSCFLFVCRCCRVGCFVKGRLA
jgi:hypothetical protein